MALTCALKCPPSREPKPVQLFLSRSLGASAHAGHREQVPTIRDDQSLCSPHGYSQRLAEAAEGRAVPEASCEEPEFCKAAEEVGWQPEGVPDGEGQVEGVQRLYHGEARWAPRTPGDRSLETQLLDFYAGKTLGFRIYHFINMILFNIMKYKILHHFFCVVNTQ